MHPIEVADIRRNGNSNFVGERSVRGMHYRSCGRRCAWRQIRGTIGRRNSGAVSHDRRLDCVPAGGIWYTDDTQTAIGVAECLPVQRGEIQEMILCRAFVNNYVPSPATVVARVPSWKRWRRAVTTAASPNSSFQPVRCNGAAMRVAPVGLLFRDDRQRLWDQARQSALPTHSSAGNRGGTVDRVGSRDLLQHEQIRQRRVLRQTDSGRASCAIIAKN